MKKFFVLLFLFSVTAEARVFDYKSVSVASMLRGAYGGTNAGTMAYGDSMGTGTYFDTQPNYEYGGEIGFVFVNTGINFVLSFEYLTTQKVSNAVGSQSKGPTKLMTLTNNMYAGVAWLGFELVMRARPHSRILLGLYGGYAMGTVENEVHVTQAGLNLFPAATSSNFEEHGSGGGGAGRITLGWEFLVSGNTTMTLEGGYRYIYFPQLAYTAATDTVLGHYNAGSEMKNNLNQSRPLDLSGAFSGLNFRIYF